MATARKRISDLTALTSASLDTVIVGVDNGTTYKIELDVLADAVTSRVNILDRSRLSSLESITSSFETKGRSVISSSAQISALGFTTSSSDLTSLNSFTSSINTTIKIKLDVEGVISGSSQLTSSYDERYVISGSITQTNWDNISGKPSGLVSQSTDLSSLNNFTASISTASLVSSINNLNTYTASQSTSSLVDRLNTIESETGSFLTSLSGAISSSTQVVGILSSLNTFTSSYFIDSASIGSRLDVLEISTSSFLTSLSGAISSSIQVLGGSGVISSSAQIDTLFNIEGLISGSSQLSGTIIPNLSGSFTGSYTGSFTGSFKGNIAGVSDYAQAIATVTTNTTTDTTLYPMFSLNAAPNSYITPTTHPSGSFYYNGVTRKVYGEAFVGAIEATNGVVSGSSQLTSSFETIGRGIISGAAQLPSGVISGSSQLTSSYDTRYTLSGSITAVPTGTISGSSQLTSSFDTRYAASGSSVSLPSGLISGSSQLTASFATTGSNTFSGSQTITGSLIVSSVAVVNGGVTIPTGSTISLISGSNLFVDSSGAITGSFTGSVFGIGDVVAFSSSVNNRIISGSAPVGTVSGSSQLTASLDTRYLTIDGDGVISGSTQLTSSFEVRGSGIYSSSAQLPSGLVSGSSQLTSSLDNIYLTIGGDNVISGSSQLTASLDTRYAASGSGGSLPSGVISGSSQLTSSLDARYLVTGSVTSSILQLNTFTASNANTSLNLFTSSLNVWSSSLATTGSNTFNGNQTITGSLNLTNGNIVASQITANTSSLYLTSGSNLYIQNTGIAEISGSLLVSGSTAFTGSISISSGSITMPNRPAFRVTGAGGPTTAVTTLSGSMTSIDFNQANCWDNTTGTFTAPIAGLYQVNLVCRTNSNSSSSGQIIVYKNNTGGTTGTPQVMIEWAANTTMNHAGGSTISKLAVGDTLKAVVAVGTLSFDGNDNFSVAYIG